MATPPTRYRNLEGMSLIDVGKRSTRTGADDVASQLAQTFASFSRVGSDIGGALTANIAAEQGTKEGLTGTPEIRKGLRAVTAYGRAYNNAAEAAYSARTQVDVDETIRRFEDEHEADPDGFGLKVAEYEKGLLEETPEELRDRTALIVRSRAAASGQRVRNQAIAKERNQNEADYVSSLPARVSNTLAMMETLTGEHADVALAESVSDNRAQLAALVNDNVLTPMQAAKYDAEYRIGIDEGLTEMRISGTVTDMVTAMKASVSRGDAMLASLDANKDLSDDDKIEIHKQYRAAREALSFERSRLHVEESGQLARSLAAEGFGPELEAENVRLYDRGAISVDEYESNISTMTRNAKASVEDGISTEAVQNAMSGGQGLDPTLKDHRDAADAYLKDVVAKTGMTVGDPRYQAFVSEMVRKTNILPASADSWARISVLSGQPEQVATGAGFLGRVNEANPRAWNYADDPRIGAMVDQVNTFMKSGIVTERAFEMAHRNVYERTDAERALLQDQYRVAIKDDDNSAALQDELDSDENFDRALFSGAPQAPLAMQAEFDSLVNQFFQLNNGDLVAARRMASDTVRATYGYTTVNGEPELMKYAPEKMFPGMTPEVIRNDVETSLRRAFGVPTVETTTLAPEEETEYRRWMESIGHTNEAGFAVTPDYTGENYDYRGYFKKYGPVKIGDGDHLYDEFKLPTHPTFSDESIYATGEAARFAGSWTGEDGETFVPPASSALPVDPSKVRLIPSPETERTGGRVFQLATLDEYGVPDVVLAPDNRAALYELPLGKAYDTARAAVAQRKLDEATAERAKIDQREKESGDLERRMFEFFNQPSFE
jgi:hypothetical protein